MPIILIFLLLLTSCNKEPPPSFLRTNIKGEPATLDPRKGGDVVSSMMHFLLFEGLTRLHTDGSIRLAQADSIELSQDRTQYTFHLKNSFWSDGTPVTAYDFEKAWKAILTPHFFAPNAHLLYPIKNAEEVKKGELSIDHLAVHSIDAKTLFVELTQPTPYFLELISFCLFFPVKHDLEATHPHWASHPNPHFVSNGPFQLTEWIHHKEITVTKNPYYWRAKEIALPGIHISMIAHDMTLLHMYESGELDLLDMWISPIPIEAQLQLAQEGLLKMRPISGSTLCVFNTALFPFHNVHIRRAFALAIDRHSIVANITQMQEEVALQVIPPLLKKGKAPPLFKDNDRERALEELSLGLQELGIDKKELNSLQYSYCFSERNHHIAQVLQQQWHQVLGINVQLQTHELKMHLDHLSRKNFQFAQSQWFAQYNDPMSFLERFKFSKNIKNYSGWENPTFNRLLEASFTVSLQQREALLEEAERLLIEEMPITPIYHWTSAVLSKPYLKHVYTFASGNPDFTQIELDVRPPPP